MQYVQLKSIARAIFPIRLLRRWETQLRKLVLFRFQGDRFLCNCCNERLDRWIVLDDQDLLCPFCGSRSRHRALIQSLSQSIPSGTLLHCSPAPALQRYFKKRSRWNYETTDWNGGLDTDFTYDLTAIDREEESVDLLIALHVLEHITEDRKALSELHRVLSRKGIAIVQTPFQDGDTYEDARITEPEDRKRAFGQEDHVRIYALHNLVDRMKQAGFQQVEIQSLEDAYLGIQPQKLLFAYKS
ncbi:class I SAM-dependent methyltransferase [Croceiramulus getboli]|nr:methyltransferase domain-containing protein [Flavobacteriaceae bacterium YJPT1-3]